MTIERIKLQNSMKPDITYSECYGAVFPKLKYGNCHIFCILFKIMNWKRSKYVLKIIKVRGLFILSSHIVYDSKFKILYRSRPKGNMTRLLFKGRPQIIPLYRIMVTAP
jgi:hypothetical protein